MRRSGHPEKDKEKNKVPHGKPKQESRLEPVEELNKLSRIKNRERVQLNKNDMVGKYKVIDLIAPDSETNESYVVQHEEKRDVNCMKIETRAEKFPILKTELFILFEIRKKADVKHFCKVYDRGQNDRFNYIVLTRTGPSLRDLRRDMPNKKLSLECGLSVGKQCLQALEELHRIGFVHRDVSPSNFCCGRREFKEESKIYLVDFAFCHQYKDSTGALKSPRLKPPRYMGSSRHAPRAAHLGMELSRADDLESWFYMFVELIKGGLPWMTFQDPAEIYKYQRKCRTGLDKQKMLGGLPKEIETMLYIIDRISYYEDPDYEAIYTLIDEAMIKNNAASAVVIHEVIGVENEICCDLRSKPFAKGSIARVSCRCTAESYAATVELSTTKPNLIVWHSHGYFVEKKYFLHAKGCQAKVKCNKEKNREKMLNGDYRLKDLVDILKSRGVEIVLILMSCQRETTNKRKINFYSHCAKDPHSYATKEFSLIKIVSEGFLYWASHICPRKGVVLKKFANRIVKDALKDLDNLVVDERRNPISVDYKKTVIYS